MSDHKAIAKERADWLLDAVACATQDRRFLRGEPEYDEVAGEAILLNAEKAIQIAIARASPTPPTTEGREAREKVLKFARDLVAHCDAGGLGVDADTLYLARALLSSPRVEEIEAAMLKYMVANNVGGSVLDILTVGSPYLRISRDVLRNALAYALSPPDGDGKQEQATRAEDGPTAPTDRL